MGLSKPADKVIFADEKVEKNFNFLEEEGWLKKALKKAIEDFKENAFCGERIKKELIPREYIKKYRIDNLLWYPLPNAWRLVYSIFSDEKELFVMIVEYYNHKEYEKRFHY